MRTQSVQSDFSWKISALSPFAAIWRQDVLTNKGMENFPWDRRPGYAQKEYSSLWDLFLAGLLSSLHVYPLHG